MRDLRGWVMRGCAVYARISRDEEQDGLGIERQMDAIDKFVAEKGWAVAPQWRLSETASASVRKPRPQFARLVTAIEQGTVSAVVAYAPDRLTRRLADMARLLDAVESTGCEVFFVVGGDMGTGYSRGMAGVLASVANMETRVMGERHRLKVRQNRREGRVTNGGTRAFGYETDRKTPRPEEFVLLREAFDRMMAGEGVSAIVKDWNRRGIPTATGGGTSRTGRPSRWETKTLRGTLSRPALCGRVTEKQRVRQSDGRMVEKRVVVSDDAGEPIIGQWPAVFTPEEFDRLQLVLEARKRMDPAWSSETKHLLTGLLVCSRCSGTMVSFKQMSGTLTYVCRDFRHLSRDEANLDRHVLGLVQEHVTGAEFPVDSWVSPDAADLARRLGDLEQRREQAIRALVAGEIQPDTLATIVGQFDRDIAALREEQVGGLVEEFEAVTFESFPDLASLPFAHRRDFVRMCVRAVIVQPSRRGRGFDPASVEVVLWPELRIERGWNVETDRVEMVLTRAPVSR